MIIKDFSDFPVGYNTGVIIVPRLETDYIFGGESKVDNSVVLQEDRNFENFLPEIEFQSNKFGDTYGCVTFSALNNTEILSRRKYGLPWNKSDRFTVLSSHTQPGYGNSLGAVGDSIRKIDGVIDETMFPWDRENETIDDYYQRSRITQAMKDAGQQFISSWLVQYEFLNASPSVFWDALQFGPLQVTVNTSAKEVDGIIQKIDNPNINHAVTCFKGVKDKYWEIFDHYTRSRKKYAWDFNFGPTAKYSLTKRTTMRLVKSQDANNKSVFFVDELGIRRVFYNENHYNAIAPVLGLAKTLQQNGGKTDWSRVELIPEDEMKRIPLGKPIFEVTA